MSLADILRLALFAGAGGLLVLLSTRFQAGGCRSCRRLRLDRLIPQPTKEPGDDRPVARHASRED